MKKFYVSRIWGDKRYRHFRFAQLDRAIHMVTFPTVRPEKSDKETSSRYHYAA